MCWSHEGGVCNAWRRQTQLHTLGIHAQTYMSSSFWMECATALWRQWHIHKIGITACMCLHCLKDSHPIYVGYDDCYLLLLHVFVLQMDAANSTTVSAQREPFIEPLFFKHIQMIGLIQTQYTNNQTTNFTKFTLQRWSKVAPNLPQVPLFNTI